MAEIPITRFCAASIAEAALIIKYTPQRIFFK
jgi:hypothetical protein